MKYIATMRKTSNNKTIRVYIDKKTKEYIVAIKENGFRTIYNVKDRCFKEIDHFKVHLLEQMVLHAFFNVNRNALLKIQEELDDITEDFLGKDLVDIDVDIEKEGCVPKLKELWTF